MAPSNVTNLYAQPNDTDVPFYKRRWFKLLQRLLRPVLNLPPLKRYLSKTRTGSTARIARLCKDGEYLKALELSVCSLEKCKSHDNDMDDYYWWFFLSHAVYCARMLDNDMLMRKLMHMADGGYRPYDGNYVAYCFCHFSHFMYMEGAYEKAVEFAERAMAADGTAGEPHYLLGFYDLFISEKDPLDHFKAAVKRDPRFLNRIVNHPSIKEFPGIINDLRSLELIDLSEGASIHYYTGAASPCR